MTYQLLYLDYIDLATGKTLVVTPGSSYTIAVANGRIAGMPSVPNDGRWLSQGGSIVPHAEPAAEPVTEVLPQMDIADTMIMPAVTDKKKGPGNGEPE